MERHELAENGRAGENNLRGMLGLIPINETPDGNRRKLDTRSYTSYAENVPIGRRDRDELKTMTLSSTGDEKI